MKNPHVLLLSVSLPTPSSETIFVCGLPFGAIEAIKAAYGNLVQILDPPRDGFNLTLKINLSKLPANQGTTKFFQKKKNHLIIVHSCMDPFPQLLCTIVFDYLMTTPH